ncbi:MAG: fibro-slime domain-containing protein [Candidatus Azobacteroides sp.]|nr:fibro-slime domain-containing protein [Candidatus Azobacteroides sp.]
MGKAIENTTKNAIIRKAEQKTDEAVNKTIDKVTNPDTYKGDGKDSSIESESKKSSSSNEDYANAENNNVTTISAGGPSVKVTDDRMEIAVTIRDFKADGLLFEGSINDGKGLVQERLGADKKTVYNLSLWQRMFGSRVTQNMLNAFFNDVPGVNMRTEKALIMKPAGNGYWNIDSSDGNSAGFFPIDNELFGNEGNGHNFHFSMELHTTFKYIPGATFEFRGDDDIWVFFNDRLIIDLGGVAPQKSAKVELDKIAPILGIKQGDIVSFDMFYMERHLTGSNLYMKTNFNFFDKSEMLLESVMNEGKFITYDITFDVGKSTIKPEAMNEINRITKLMKENPNLKFSVEGHTDSTGNAASNQTLSDARSKAVVDKLVEMGISADRLQSAGKGQTSPIADNSTDEGRAKNRRVEFVKIN